MDKLPSKIDLAVGMILAYHQMADDPRLTMDPLGVRMIGVAAEIFEDLGINRPDRLYLRLFAAATDRFAEDAIASATKGGTRQIVFLDCGLTTLPYRNAYPGVEIFELNDLAVLQWKRERLNAYGTTIPANVHSVSDAMRHSVGHVLAGTGFDPGLPTCVVGLGGITRETLDRVLRFADSLPAVELVFTYLVEPDFALSADLESALLITSELSTAAGKSKPGMFGAGAIDRQLRAKGFTQIEDLPASELLQRYACGSPPDTDIVNVLGGHTLRATRPGSQADQAQR